MKEEVKILLVEDSVADQKHSKVVLKDTEYKITVATNLKEAYDKMHQIKPDLVLIDLNLPDGTGNDFMIDAKVYLDEHIVPVIFLSGDDNPNPAVEAMKKGAADYLLKNEIASGRLERSIQQALRSGHLQKDIKKSKEELINEKNRALRASQFKTEFLARMSHEIRNPLHSIIGMSDLLRANPSKEEHDKYIDTLAHSSNALLGLINDILDISKIEAGEIELDEKEMILEELIAEFYEVVSIQAEKKGIELIKEGDGQREKTIVADFVRLKQILINFLSNAIKFTDKGSVTLSTQIKNEQLIFIVMDTGIGIPKDKQKTIFESYKQADDTEANKYSGTGLGLAICKKLVDMMEGEIKVKSEEGKGATFTVSLPIKEGAQITEAQKENLGSISKLKFPDLKGHKVLVVDDNEVNRFVMESFCKKFNCEYDFATNGSEALKKAKTNEYSIVFMDIKMPVMDGKEAMRRLKSDQYSKPVVALTGNQFDDNEAQNLGFASYLMKPVRPQDLADDIESYGKK